MPLDVCNSCEPDSSLPSKAPLSVRLVTLAGLLVPLLGFAAAIVLLWQASFHWIYLTLFGGMYAITVLGVGVGFHRLFTHKSFETNGVLRFLWAVLGSMSVEGPVIKWVALHRKHHQFTDVPGDPHSPHGVHVDDHGELQQGARGVIRGLWHAHIGWAFDNDPPDVHRYAPDLEQDSVVRFVSRTFALWAVLGLFIPAAIGGIIMGTWMGALLGLLWGGLARILVVHHLTWSINSVCHLWGSRPFNTRDQSRDNPIFGVLAFGEGWHNTHHAFPTSARHGLSWWKLDVNYLVIRVMELLHLARNVRLPSSERVWARRRGTAEGTSPSPRIEEA